MGKAKVALITVGAVSIAGAALGIWYNWGVLPFLADTGRMAAERGMRLPRHWLPTVYTMSGICVACNALLIVCGVQFLRLRTRVFRFFVALMAFEVVYFITTNVLARAPGIGGIAAGLGLANGGLAPQEVMLLPLWAPFLARWAVRTLRVAEAS